MQSIKVDREWVEFGIEYLDKRCTAESRAAVGVERGSLGAHSCQVRSILAAAIAGGIADGFKEPYA